MAEKGFEHQHEDGSVEYTETVEQAHSACPALGRLALDQVALLLKLSAKSDEHRAEDTLLDAGEYEENNESSLFSDLEPVSAGDSKEPLIPEIAPDVKQEISLPAPVAVEKEISLDIPPPEAPIIEPIVTRSDKKDSIRSIPTPSKIKKKSKPVRSTQAISRPVEVSLAITPIITKKAPVELTPVPKSTLEKVLEPEVSPAPIVEVASVHIEDKPHTRHEAKSEPQPEPIARFDLPVPLLLELAPQPTSVEIKEIVRSNTNTQLPEKVTEAIIPVIESIIEEVEAISLPKEAKEAEETLTALVTTLYEELAFEYESEAIEELVRDLIATPDEGIEALELLALNTLAPREGDGTYERHLASKHRSIGTVLAEVERTATRVIGKIALFSVAHRHIREFSA